jgi:transposase
LDASKLKISMALADARCNGDVRFYGDISSSPGSVTALIKKLAKPGVRLHFCYEAGPTGDEFYRHIVRLGGDCTGWHRRRSPSGRVSE